MPDNENLKVKRNLTALVEFSRVINSSLDLNFILNNVLLTCLGKFLATKGLIALKFNNKLVVKAFKGIADESIKQFPVVEGVGYHSAKFFQDAGAKIVALAEYEGAIWSADGLNVDEVFNHRKSTGSILNFPGAKNFDKSTDALEMECDILIPAALENVIDGDNAPRIKAKMIGEAANGPLTPEADEVFAKKGILVVPDMYLNAGGVTVSYFEWLKNLSHVRYGRLEKRFTENLNTHILGQMESLTGKKVDKHEREFIMHGPDEVDLVYSGLEETMITATREIMDCWKNNADIPDMRTAAYVVAINKVGNSYAELGIFP